MNYDGPCPPFGIHKYLFTLYALDDTIDLPEGSTVDKLKDSMKSHILGESTIIGLSQIVSKTRYRS